MKWSIFVCLVVCTARFCDGFALKCPPGVTDSSCTEERIPTNTEEPSNSESSEAQCLAGSEWESNCHYCRCSSTGLAECSKLDICDKGAYAEPLLCKPNTTFQRDCNTCVCLENGLGLCTLSHCSRPDSPVPTHEVIEESLSEFSEPDVPTLKSGHTDAVVQKVTLSRKVRAFTPEPPKACQPGQEFRMDCNKCLCDNKGQDFSCTRIDCNALNNNHNNGFSGPRTKRDADPGFRCNPGEQFKRDCNDCTCSADGKSVFCTLRLCDQDLTPDI